MRMGIRACLLAAFIVVCGCSGGPKITRVVLVTLDTTRADRLGVYGYDKDTTPNLDAFALGATVFEQAVSQVPTTLPSHSTMMTGLYPQDHALLCLSGGGL